jgi:hypothetical protein
VNANCGKLLGVEAGTCEIVLAVFKSLQTCLARLSKIMQEMSAANSYDIIGEQAAWELN